MDSAWRQFRETVYGSLYSYPRFTWQTVVPDTRRISKLDVSDSFLQGVELFLSCADSLESSPLYVNDAIGFKMIPEQPLFYSENCFGTTDAIVFRNRMIVINVL